MKSVSIKISRIHALASAMAILGSSYSPQASALVEAPTINPAQKMIQSFGFDPAKVDASRFSSRGMNIAGLMNQIKATVPGFPGLNVFPSTRPRARIQAPASMQTQWGHPTIVMPREAQPAAAVTYEPLYKDYRFNLASPPSNELNSPERDSLDLFWDEYGWNKAWEKPPSYVPIEYQADDPLVRKVVKDLRQKNRQAAGAK